MDIKDYIKSGIIESYVLGVADEQDVAELDKLRLQYPEIQAAIDDCERALEANAIKNAIPVTSSLKDNLLATLGADFPAPTPVLPAATQPVHRLGRYKMMAIAAAALLLISIATNIFFYAAYKKINDNYTVLLKGQQLMLADNQYYQQHIQTVYQHIRTISNPGMLKVELPGVKGRESDLVTVYWNTNTKEVYLLANNLPKAPEGKQYQLWALVDGKPVDAGMLDNCEGICKLKNTEKAQAFAITLENAGGSPTPTLDQMYVMGQVKA